MATNPVVRFKLGDYFRPGSHKVAMSKGEVSKEAASLPELLQQTNAFSVKNRGGCTPKLTGSNPKELFLHYNVKCTLKTSDPNGHDVKVRFDISAVTDEVKAKDLDVQCSCTCPAFLMWGAQWNLHQQDALEGEPRPLLTAPTERLDLRNQFVICKHIKAVFDRILPSVQHNIVKIVRERTVEKKKKEQAEKGIPTAPPVPKRKPPTRKAPLPDAETPAPPVEDTKHVIKRDTPATPEEREKVPVLHEENVPVPDATPEPKLAPIPTIPDLDDIPEIPEPEHPVQPAKAPEVKEPEPVKPAPAVRTPQKPNNNSTPQDREYMKRLQREEQKRQQRQMQQRLRSNPGRR